MIRVSPLALGLLFALVSTARADSSAEAKQHFEEGTKAFNLGEFPRAVTEYKAAYQAKPDPVFLYNIAQAYRLHGDLQQAVFFYRTFLNNMPNAPNKREVERRITTLEAQIAQQKAVATTPPNTPVAPTSTTVEQPPTQPPPEPPPATTTTPVATTPAPPPAATTTPVASSTSTAPANDAKQPIYKKWWLWTIVGGVVVVGVAVGVGVGVGASGGPPDSHFGATTFF
jgi:tetratricopeptide (TPR) repeat protein